MGSHPLDFVVFASQTQFAAEILNRNQIQTAHEAPVLSPADIVQMRLKHGMSQEDLAKAVNVKKNLLSRVEKKEVKLSNKLAKLIQQHFEKLTD